MKQRKFVAVIAIVLVLALGIGILAACNHVEPMALPEKPFAKDALDEVYNALNMMYVYSEAQQADLDAIYSSARVAIDGAADDAAAASALNDALVAFKGVEYVSANSFTNNSAMSVFPTNWNPHTYQTATDGDALGYMSDGFYTFDYNDDRTGYKMIPSTAVDFPVDVTADYVGEDWAIEEGETGRAWKITLKDNLAWDDGTPITAQDYVDSAIRLLNPDADNYRADSLYSGNMVIFNAKKYAYAGSIGMFPSDTVFAHYSEDIDSQIVFHLGGTSAAAGGLDSVCSFRAWLESQGISADYTALQIANIMVLNWASDLNGSTAEEIAALEGKTLAEIKADEAMAQTWANVIGFWQTLPDEELDFFLSEYTWPEVDFESVGIKAVSDHELVLILEDSLSGFYLHYSLTSDWLVKTDVYDACITIKDGVYSNSYGTSVETSPSCGPYKMVQFQNDKVIKYERNEHWHGYDDLSNLGRYMTTNINIQFVEQASTRLQMFLSGQLDGYGLTAEDMADYQQSDYTYFTTGDSTFFIALNPDMKGLEAEQAKTPGTNKTILTVLEFRQAISFALDRAAFCLATAPTNNSAFGVFSSFIVSNPETGETYRSTDQAKQALVNFWGLANDIGEGKLYETVDDAIESITGYNLTKAKELFNTAYDKAIELGLMSATDVVEIKIGTPNATSSFYSKGYEFLVNNYTDAVVGTKLEGKLRFTLDNTLGNAFSDALKANQVDLLFGVGWTGSALDPYGLVEAYTSPNYQYDPAWDTTRTQLTINLGGVDYTATVMDWTIALSGKTINVFYGEDNKESMKMSAGSDADATTRLIILAALENAVLETYDMIPIMDDSSASLKSMKVDYYTEDYVYGVGRGGLRYMTYRFTDSEWAAFVQSHGGELNYR